MAVLGEPQLHSKFEITSFSRCTNIKGNPKYWGALIVQDHIHFSLVWDFIMGLGKPKLYTKFEVASFSHCVNIEGQPSNLGELPYSRATPTLSSACDFMMGLGIPLLRAKFEVASPSCCRNIIRKPKILGSSPSLRPHSLFPLGVILWWPLTNPSWKQDLK